MEEHQWDGLRNGLNALYGHDLASAQRELEWVQSNLDKAPDLSPVAEALKEIVTRLECS